MADEQQLKFTLVIDKNTGAVKQVASELDGVANKASEVGKKSKEASKEGADGFDKLGGKVMGFASSLVIAQLALEGIKKVAQQNDAFQELQTIIMDTARTLIDVFGPAISMISKGLSGLLTIIGAAGKAAKQMVQGDWNGAMDTMAASVERAAGIIENRVVIITKNMQEAAATRLAQEEQHQQAVHALNMADADRRMNALHLTEDQKLAIIEEKHQLELTNLEKAQSLKRQQLELEHAAHSITEQQYQARLSAIKQQGADQRKLIDMKSANEAAAIQRERTTKMEGFFRQEIQAGASAAIARYEQTKNVGEAVRAAAGAEVSAAADYAAEYIMIQGAKAAAAAYFNAVSTTPGPAGVVAGAAAAIGTMAFYTGLAAVVGVAGHAIGGAIGGSPSGGGGGGGDTGGSGGGGGFGGGGDFASAPTGAQVSGPGASGGGGGNGAIHVTVYLEGDVLFRAISNASRDGRVVITARNVVP